MKQRHLMKVALGRTVPLLPFVLLGCDSPGSASLDEGPLASVVEEIRIGSVDDPEYAFGMVVALEVGSDGTIYTLHRPETIVRRWAPDGRGAGVIGRRGEGPGEFTEPRSLGWQGDSLWVFDSSRNSRITFFDGDGTYLGVLTPQVDLGSAEQNRLGIYPARPAGLLADGSIYGVTPGFSHAIVEGSLTSLAHVRMDAEGAVLDTIANIPVGQESILGVLRDGGGTFSSQPFGDAVLALLDRSRNGLLVLERTSAQTAAEAEFRLHRLDLGGDTVLSRGYAYRPVPVASDTIQKAIDGIAEGLHSFIGERTGTSLAQWRGWVREAMYVPAHYTPISHLASGRDGTIWLARNPSGESGTEWLILDGDGEPVGRLVTPAGFRLLLADRSTLWGVERDDLDVEYIVRYRVEFP